MRPVREAARRSYVASHFRTPSRSETIIERETNTNSTTKTNSDHQQIALGETIVNAARIPSAYSDVKSDALESNIIDNVSNNPISAEEKLDVVGLGTCDLTPHLDSQNPKEEEGREWRTVSEGDKPIQSKNLAEENIDVVNTVEFQTADQPHIISVAQSPDDAAAIISQRSRRTWSMDERLLTTDPGPHSDSVGASSKVAARTLYCMRKGASRQARSDHLIDSDHQGSSGSSKWEAASGQNELNVENNRRLSMKNEGNTMSGLDGEDSAEQIEMDSHSAIASSNGEKSYPFKKGLSSRGLNGTLLIITEDGKTWRRKSIKQHGDRMTEYFSCISCEQVKKKTNTGKLPQLASHYYTATNSRNLITDPSTRSHICNNVRSAERTMTEQAARRRKAAAKLAQMDAYYAADAINQYDGDELSNWNDNHSFVIVKEEDVAAMIEEWRVVNEHGDVVEEVTDDDRLEVDGETASNLPVEEVLVTYPFKTGLSHKGVGGVLIAITDDGKTWRRRNSRKKGDMATEYFTCISCESIKRKAQEGRICVPPSSIPAQLPTLTFRLCSRTGMRLLLTNPESRHHICDTIRSSAKTTAEQLVRKRKRVAKLAGFNPQSAYDFAASEAQETGQNEHWDDSVRPFAANNISIQELSTDCRS
ncbi:hypothetical protein AB6A40_005930 [Gnathostoma spinigerum]|uniref:Uncharacterized protein n=1 Tax=Gnathostoma spinigerum TaxID=75299 RepID=A0ABD6EHL8_9BILA